MIARKGLGAWGLEGLADRPTAARSGEVEE
jgi:hypothetical protein